MFTDNDNNDNDDFDNNRNDDRDDDLNNDHNGVLLRLSGLSISTSSLFQIFSPISITVLNNICNPQTLKSTDFTGFLPSLSMLSNQCTISERLVVSYISLTTTT